MNTGLIGLYALFLIFVGYRGNAATLFQYVGADPKGFSEWVVAILILRALDSVDSLKPFVKPFAALAVLTFVLENYTTVASQVDAITGTTFAKGKTP